MNNLFPGYYRPTDSEFNDIWSNCIFVFDANILLNFYRYSDDMISTFKNIFEKISDRVWIPHQVALEYHYNRVGVIFKQESSYDELAVILSKKVNEISSELGSFSKHSKINTKEILNEIQGLFSSIQDRLNIDKANHPNLISSDHPGEYLASYFNNKIGSPFTQEELSEIYKEGESRYENEIPPGFNDNKKTDHKIYDGLIIPNKFGDLILWKQLINRAIQEEISIIFVTDDVKPDWWNKLNGKTIGPHPMLIREFQIKTNKTFYMYQTDQFIKYSNNFLNLQKTEDQIKIAIKEAQEISENNKQIYPEPLPTLIPYKYEPTEEEISDNLYLTINKYDNKLNDNESESLKIYLRGKHIKEKYNIDRDFYTHFKRHIYLNARKFIKSSGKIEKMVLSNYLKLFFQECNRSFIEDCLQYDFINKDLELTNPGINFIIDLWLNFE